MSFYGELATTADELLEELGQEVQITHRTSGTYNPATSSATPGSTSQTGRAAIFDREAKDIDGTHIQVGDQRMLLSPIGVSAPVVGDTVALASSKVYSITAITAIAPAGTVVLYDGNLRG